MSLSEQKEIWQNLQRTEGWKLLVANAIEQAKGRENTILLTPLKCADDAFEQEFMKGEVAALRLVIQLPELAIQQLEADIEALNKEGIKDENT